MKAIEAIYIVLKDAGIALSSKEIAQRILEAGLWTTQGKTPEATIASTLYVDIKDHGSTSRFIRVGSGHFGLNPDYNQVQELPDIQKPLQIDVGESISVAEPKTYSFADAAEHILRTYAHQRPMHYQAITEKALKLKLLSSKGLTPEATMYAQIITEVDRRRKRGEQPRFILHGKGLVGLAAWEPEGLAGLIDSHNRKVRKQLLRKLQEMPADEFEKLIARLLTAIGFEDVILTPYSGDKGIDIRGTLVVGYSIRTRMAVQVKKWKHNVQSPAIQQVRGSLSTHEQGLIITTSDFSSGAISEASQPDKIPVALMNGEKLVDLLIENNIGIIRSNYDLLEIGESEIAT